MQSKYNSSDERIDKNLVATLATSAKSKSRPKLKMILEDAMK
jgi:hypothetical protein